MKRYRTEWLEFRGTKEQPRPYVLVVETEEERDSLLRYINDNTKLTLLYSGEVD